MEAEMSEMGEEEPTSFAIKPELEDINDNQAEEADEEMVERAPGSYTSKYRRKISRTKR